MTCPPTSVNVTIPYKCVAAMVVASGASVLGAPVILSAAGFTSAGIAGGSLAALWQSTMATISSGSLFALLQKIPGPPVAPFFLCLTEFPLNVLALSPREGCPHFPWNCTLRIAMAGLSFSQGLTLSGTVGAAALLFCREVNKLCGGCIGDL